MAKKTPRPAVPAGVTPNPRHKGKDKLRPRKRHSYVSRARSTRIFHFMYKQDDRTLAIMGANLIEHQLVLAIEKRFRKLSVADHNRLFDGESSALGRFHAKIQIGYALNLFGRPEYNELMRIKSIRNMFAHRLAVRFFNGPDIKRECLKLVGAAHFDYYGTYSPDGPHPPARTARERFLRALIAMHTLLEDAGAHARRPKFALKPTDHFAGDSFRAWLEIHAPQHLPRVQTQD